jgi:hypothetical protein
VEDVNKLENIQRKAVGMISGLKSRIYEERCSEIGLKTLADRRQEQGMALAYKFSKGVGNLKTDVLFERIPARTGPVTRLAGSGENFLVPRARLDVRKQSFAVRAVRNWNDLPIEVKMATNKEQFKRALRKHNENGGRPL